MSFRLRDILGAKVAETLAPVRNCPTGKTPYPTKRAADLELRRLNQRQTTMRRFRCPFCEQFHLGHRRGVI